MSLVEAPGLGADEEPPVGLRDAAKSYKDAWNNSTDPLAKVFSDVGA